MINVSVIVPTYNYAQYIGAAINSVLEQNYTLGEVEIVVVDDGSTDNTSEVLKEYIDNGLIKYYYQDNKGKASATSFAIEKATGEYIFNLDADDLFLPDKLTKYVYAFGLNDRIVHVGSAAKIYDQDKNSYSVENIPEDLLAREINGYWLLYYFYNNYILFGGGSTYAARASVLKKITIPDGVDMFIDEFLILALLPLGKSFFLESPKSIWRVHSSNYSGRKATQEVLNRKEERLLRSSGAILEYLEQVDFDVNLIRIYRLLDATRKITLKENLNKKSMIDIFRYVMEVIAIGPDLHLVKRYNVLNRLIPTQVLRVMKRGRNWVRNQWQESTSQSLTENVETVN